VVLRIYTLNPLAGVHMPPAGKKFHVVGMGAQQSTSTAAPFAFNGYFIVPRKAADIILVGDSVVNPGVAETQADAGISVYPNPAAGIIHIHAEKLITDIEITDITGKVLRTEHATGNRHAINSSEWSRGVYFVKVTCGAVSTVKRVIVQ
jgi:hypothetical protein